MNTAPNSKRVTYIVLRHMRRPILVLISVYAFSMVGWILIPGFDEHGNPRNLGFFHAFYFLTYTVTTTGFGELPTAFTEAQRMWGIVSLYVGVIAWFYALGSIVGLVQNPEFQHSIAERNFAKRVARVTEPFCIVCGFGNTGALLTRGLSDAGLTVIVVETDEERTKTVMLRDYRTPVASLCANAQIPEHLIEAGLLKSNCKAVIAVTSSEDINLKIAVSARLLNPEAWIVTQSTSATHEETLSTLGKNVHIIDPFQTYAKYLGAVIHDSALHTLNQWLAGTPGATLDNHLGVPKGTWILCGFGRMGQWIRDALETEGIETAVIEPNPREQDRDIPGLIVGRATQQNLELAGIKTAAGIVIGTNSDSDNLSILLNARALNPAVFSLVRQNKFRNQVVFQAAHADFIMMPSMVSARRILFQLIAPLMKSFFEAVRGHDALIAAPPLDEVVERLATVVGGSQPRVWTVETDAGSASALSRLVTSGHVVRLDDLLRDPLDRTRHLACVALVVRSGEDLSIMPSMDVSICPGDQILLVGSPAAMRLFDATLNNEYTLRYLMTGVEEPRGYLMQWMAKRFPAGRGGGEAART